MSTLKRLASCFEARRGEVVTSYSQFMNICNIYGIKRVETTGRWVRFVDFFLQNDDILDFPVLKLAWQDIRQREGQEEQETKLQAINFRAWDVGEALDEALDQTLAINDHNWLVVWNMNFIFPHIGNFIIPTTNSLHNF